MLRRLESVDLKGHLNDLLNDLSDQRASRFVFDPKQGYAPSSDLFTPAPTRRRIFCACMIFCGAQLHRSRGGGGRVGSGGGVGWGTAVDG